MVFYFQLALYLLKHAFCILYAHICSESNVVDVSVAKKNDVPKIHEFISSRYKYPFIFKLLQK